MTTVEDIEKAIERLEPADIDRLRVWFEQFRASRVEAAGSVESAADSKAVRYPNVTVRLGDLGTDIGPIIRRVSYAMSDANVSDAEIEQYKSQVKAEADPIAVTKRWVAVQQA